MATATWLHYSSTSRALLASFRCRPAFSSGDFRRHSRFLPTAAGFFSRSSQSRFHLTTTRAQAKRGFSLKEDREEVASPEDLQFEAPLKIVQYPDPILRAKNKRISTFDDNLKKIVHHMFDVMYKTDGIGLSAPQVGLNVQLMVFNTAGERGVGEEIVLVNPRVSKYSRKTRPFNEGCLSFPGIYGDVVRPESIRIDARDISGARFSVSMSGLSARVFQHEYDHLLGVLFFDRMTEEVLDSIRAELLALEKKYEERTGLPSPERIETCQGIKAPAIETREGIRAPAAFGNSRS